MVYKLIKSVSSFLGQVDLQYEVIRWLQEWQKKRLTQPGDYLEFGSYKGHSAVNFYNALKKFYKNRPPKDQFHMFLFDSFRGLPRSNHPADNHPLWKAGTFDVGGAEAFKKILVSKKIPEDRFAIVEGFYEDSLPKFNKKLIKRASFIYMDCDYYTSTKIALNFCKNYLQNFTLIYFDDLFSFAGNPNKGQVLAISEFNKENKDIGLVHCPILDYVAPGKIWWVWRNEV